MGGFLTRLGSGIDGGQVDLMEEVTIITRRLLFGRLMCPLHPRFLHPFSLLHRRQRQGRPLRVQRPMLKLRLLLDLFGVVQHPCEGVNENQSEKSNPGGA